MGHGAGFIRLETVVQNAEAQTGYMYSIGSKFQCKNTPCGVQTSTLVLHLALWPFDVVLTVLRPVLRAISVLRSTLPKNPQV